MREEYRQFERNTDSFSGIQAVREEYRQLERNTGSFRGKQASIQTDK